MKSLNIKIHLCAAVVTQKLHLNWYNYKCINNVENNALKQQQQQKSLLNVCIKAIPFFFSKHFSWYCLIISYYNIKFHISYTHTLNHFFFATISWILCVYILGVARYTDVTVRYVPRFRRSRFDTISVQHEKKKSTMLGFFSFILNRQ